MNKPAVSAASAESPPEIRFRPSAEVYQAAIQFAERLGLSVTDVARIGLAQVAHNQRFSLDPVASPAWRDLPMHGASLGQIADLAAAAGLQEAQAHVQAGRLPASALVAGGGAPR